MDAFFFVFLALFFQTFLPDFSVWFRFSRCERFLQNVPGTMVFTMFSAHSHFVQTLFFQSFPFKFASKFRLFFALIFVAKIEKISSKISSEPDFAVGSTFCSILAHFFRFLANFDRFWEAWGGWWAAFLEFLGLQKREQNLRGFWGAFLRTMSPGRRVPRSRLRLEKPLKIAWYGMVWKDGKQARDLARPGPEGGRIVNASRCPPTLL